MSEIATLARPYAVAAYKRAKETASTAQWSDTLAFLSQVMQDPQVAQAVANPKTKKDQFTKAFLDLCGGELDTESGNFVQLLVANGRLHLIHAIAEQFEQYRAEEEGYIDVEVCSAYPLEEGEREKLAAVLQTALGRQPRLHVRIDDALIGGVLIKAGDRVIDASVRGQVQRLATRLYN
ncbi:MAG: synthase subunit delta [Proteobacteria bacterium]|nr:synthase subunit delta [Pseudomonadota bacterium]